MKKKCFIIGNGALSCDLSSVIDAADYVVRFNEPLLQQDKAGHNWSGEKTDCLWMCNSGKPMQLKLASQQFLHSPFLRTAQELILVYHPEIICRFFKQPPITSRLLKARKRDWTLEAINKLGGMGKKITIMPPQFYLQACAQLGIEGERLKHFFPSTGYLGIWQMLQQCSEAEWTISLAGFSWQGWKRHDWQAEKNWVKAQLASGKLRSVEN